MNKKNKKVKSFNFSKMVKPATISVVLLAVCFAGFKIYSSSIDNDLKDSSDDGPTTEQIQQSSEIDAENKRDFIEENTENGEAVAKPPDTDSSNFEITAKKESNSTVTITTKLPGVSSGTCLLGITNGSTTVNKSATVIYQPEFSTCAGFSIPISELGTGTWSISLRLAGDSSSKSVSFEVN